LVKITHLSGQGLPARQETPLVSWDELNINTSANSAPVVKLYRLEFMTIPCIASFVALRVVGEIPN
jgi:hypothetical protein